jgi:hypothetical protein
MHEGRELEAFGFMIFGMYGIITKLASGRAAPAAGSTSQSPAAKHQH